MSAVGSSKPSSRSYPDPIRAQLEVPQLTQPVQALDLSYLVLYEVQVPQFLQMRDVLNMLYFVEAEVETGQVGQIVQVLNVTDQVIVEIEFGERPGNLTREVDFLNLILAKAYSLYFTRKVNGEYKPPESDVSYLDFFEPF